MEIDRTQKVGGFVKHLIRGILGFFYKFRKIYFRKKAYKSGYIGFRYACMKGFYVFLLHVFVGLKPKSGYRYWEDKKNKYVFK